ncbi:MAG TPA: o-succinylbenzoate synthase [candidate division Zixibacteria bacterium]|nr:o-succinylbenzoate synthase [candidate division Zixibacteria bacterium]
MIISELTIYRFSLPLKKALKLVTGPVTEREGFVVKVTGDEGQVGYGEIAPLPGFSRETIDEIPEAIKQLKAVVVGNETPENLEELSGGFKRWLSSMGLPYSVRFGFESAVLGAMASERGLSLCRLLSDSPRKHVTFNCMLSHGTDEEVLAAALERQAEGFKTFKLKIGRGDPAIDVALVASLRQTLGDGTVIRLDANRQYTCESIGGFVEAIKSIGVEYIEEPLPTRAENLQWAKAGKLPVALDESVGEIEPEEAAACPGVIAVLLKPTRLGLERTVRFARAASSRSIMPVISSSFESSLGLSILAHLALVVTRHEIAMGLATADIFAHDLLDKPLLPIDARVARADIPDPAESIQMDRLTEVKL